MLEGAVPPLATPPNAVHAGGSPEGSGDANGSAAFAAPATPAIPAASDLARSSFGWVSGGLPVPATGGVYVVEFAGSDNEVRVLAYIDPFGRAFATEEPLSVPPARKPDLSFVKSNQQPSDGEELGCVYAHTNGEAVEVAQYRCERGRYTLFDSWFDFATHGSNLTYNDAMARAYLAFVHRPSLGGAAVPQRGLGSIFAHIRSEKPLTELRTLVNNVRAVEADPALRAPALARSLAQWLTDAGLEALAARRVKDDAIRLVRTVRYSNTYYLACDDESAHVFPHEIWALEAALNRFLLISETYGDRAAQATEAECARWDAQLFETVALQEPVLDGAVDAPDAPPGGEWLLRCVLSSALERLRLPVRVEATLRMDVAAQAVAFDLKVPNGSFMPSRLWREETSGGEGEEVSAEDREALARRYAMQVGLLLATAAFDASPAFDRVDLVARPFRDARDVSQASKNEGLSPEECSEARAYYQAVFTRSEYEGTARFADARSGDPEPLFVAGGARFDVTDADAFAFIESCVSTVLHRDLPEMCESCLADPARAVFGASQTRDVRINYSAAYRRMAERLADSVVRAPSAADAVSMVRAAQKDARATRDDRAIASCTRLMAALAEGAVDTSDQNAVVGSFLGEDRCFTALARARMMGDRNPEEAAGLLIDAVMEAVALDGYVDGATTVYRTFDSYAARLLYNRARAGLASTPARAARDANKRVELASDSFYLCHLEIVRLLEHSFERTDEALRYGQRALELAPATAAGYRQLGRAYMLVGDMDNASETLTEGLRVAVQPNDIAMLYYQLAYVRWKAGFPQAGAACYAKSLGASSLVAVQATAELQELVEETGVALPPRDGVDEELACFDIPVAPTAEVLDLLDEGAVAATDAGLFPVARNLLALRLRYRLDDALVNVMRSLED